MLGACKNAAGSLIKAAKPVSVAKVGLPVLSSGELYCPVHLSPFKSV